MNETILGKNTVYSFQYNNDLLFPIARKIGRDAIKSSSNLDIVFQGVDIWNCYEMSWLTQNGLPEVRMLKLYIDANSPNIVESKSLKLYLMSFSNHRFKSDKEVANLIQNDLSNIVDFPVQLKMMKLSEVYGQKIACFQGENIDNAVDINIEHYNINKELLSVKSENIVKEELYSNLLKSNCLVTNQPDWASIYIKYKGQQIDRRGLLKYIISFRDHNEFHEQCVEHVFTDIMTQCKPEELTVYAKYTRRGGIDINPYRSNMPYNLEDIDQVRDARQ